MRVREMRQGTGRVLVVVCDKHEEAMGAIGRALEESRMLSARVTAVGGFAAAELGWFDRDARDYRRIPVSEQVEVLSLLGDVAEQDGSPALHVHAVLGRRGGSTAGGHLLRGTVWPTPVFVVTYQDGTTDLFKQADRIVVVERRKRRTSSTRQPRG